MNWLTAVIPVAIVLIVAVTMGVGAALLRRVAEIAVERGCARLEWAALDWNAPALGFYEKLGAEQLGEWVMHRLDGEALERVAGRPPSPSPG